MKLSVLVAGAESPDDAALIVGSRALTFAELAAHVSSRIRWLAHRGVPTLDGRPVALVGTSDLSTLVTLYALIEIGQSVALIHPRFTSAERQAALDVSAPVHVLEEAPPILENPALTPVPATDPRDIDDERCLAILSTSGTTGTPKGIVLSRRAFLASARASEKNLGFFPGDRWLLGLPIAHVGGLSILTRCLVGRRTVVVPHEVSAGQKLDAEALIRAIADSAVTLISLVPTQLEWLFSRQPEWSIPSTLRAVLLGGAAARPALLAHAADRGVPVLTTYGLTEACSQVTTQPLGTVNRGEGGSGVPMGVEVRIVDGVIHVRGPALFSGYRPPESKSPFDAEGWFATDDLGRLDDEGRLHVLGRRSDVIVTGGENVYPAEVEAMVETCPGVAAACVFGVPDAVWGELVAIAIVPAPSGPPSDAALAEFVRASLAPHRRPRLVAYLDALATTPAGKLDRKATATLAIAAMGRRF